MKLCLEQSSRQFEFWRANFGPACGSNEGRDALEEDDPKDYAEHGYDCKRNENGSNNGVCIFGERVWVNRPLVSTGVVLLHTFRLAVSIAGRARNVLNRECIARLNVALARVVTS